MKNTAKKLPPIQDDRPEEYVQFHCDAELKDELVKALPKKMSIKDAGQRGLLHVLNELNPKAAKRLFEVVKLK